MDQGHGPTYRYDLQLALSRYVCPLGEPPLSWAQHLPHSPTMQGAAIITLGQIGRPNHFSIPQRGWPGHCSTRNLGRSNTSEVVLLHRSHGQGVLSQQGFDTVSQLLANLESHSVPNSVAKSVRLASHRHQERPQKGQFYLSGESFISAMPPNSLF
jgi:hypothetical protein